MTPNGSDRPPNPAIHLEVPPHTATDRQFFTQAAFTAKGDHSTKAAPKVDRVQVHVHSKGQAIGGFHGNPGPALPLESGRISCTVDKDRLSQIARGEAEPHALEVHHHSDVEVECAILGPGKIQSVVNHFSRCCGRRLAGSEPSAHVLQRSTEHDSLSQ